MMENLIKENSEIFVSFLDDKNVTREGIFIFLGMDDNFLSIKTQKGNLIIVPINRIQKIKQSKRDDDGKNQS